MYILYKQHRKQFLSVSLVTIERGIFWYCEKSVIVMLAFRVYKGC